MTEKQAKILKTALQLFAEQGYNSTPTSRVAKEAEVSEGLIFRHFGSKQGLLDAIMEQGNSKLKTQISGLLEETDPQKVINLIIALPFNIPESDFDFWRLLYALKWQRQNYDLVNIAPLERKAAWAFEALEFDDPFSESVLLMATLDGIAAEILLKNDRTENKILEALKNKYSPGGKK